MSYGIIPGNAGTCVPSLQCDFNIRDEGDYEKSIHVEAFACRVRCVGPTT